MLVEVPGDGQRRGAGVHHEDRAVLDEAAASAPIFSFAPRCMPQAHVERFSVAGITARLTAPPWVRTR